MADYIELDFLDVETEKSGDAIVVRYEISGTKTKHVIDGGYIDTGEKLIEHLKKWHDGIEVDHVVLTHPDQDHANGLRKILETCTVGKLWMHRPWQYAQELLPRFPTYSSVDKLRSRLRSAYSAAAALEDIAIERKIPIGDPFQGTQIGSLTVVAPTKARYLDLVVESEKTPQHEEKSLGAIIGEAMKKVAIKASELVKRAWGVEVFPASGTSNENEMSVVQFGVFNGKRVLLTADAGRQALKEAADYVESMGHALPGFWCFQVPHHGGRHNVNTEILNRLCGPILKDKPENYTWNAICSSAKADTHHPKKVVIRAMIHRGAHFSTTEGRNLYLNIGKGRNGYSSVDQAVYPDDQEED